MAHFLPPGAGAGGYFGERLTRFPSMESTPEHSEVQS